MKVGLHETTWGDPLGRRLLIYGAELGGGGEKNKPQSGCKQSYRF